VLTDNIDEEDARWARDNRYAVARKYCTIPDRNLGWGEKGREADRKVIFDAEKKKMEKQIEEAKVKQPNLKVPQILWKYALRRGRFHS
jgi:hypothetical protein